MAWRPDYCTLGEIKSFVNISDTVDDAVLGFAITAAARAIDDHTRRQFGQVGSAETRYYDARFNTRRQQWVIEFDDLQDTTGLTVTAAAGAITAYKLYPRNAAAEGRPYERLIVDRASTVQPKPGEGELALLGKWGWTAVPVPVKEANLLQGSRVFSRRTSPYGVAGSPDLGSELRLLAKVDPDVAVALRDYRRWAWVG